MHALTAGKRVAALAGNGDALTSRAAGDAVQSRADVPDGAAMPRSMIVSARTDDN